MWKECEKNVGDSQTKGDGMSKIINVFKCKEIAKQHGLIMDSQAIDELNRVVCKIMEVISSVAIKLETNEAKKRKKILGEYVRMSVLFGEQGDECKKEEEPTNIENNDGSKESDLSVYGGVKMTRAARAAIAAGQMVYIRPKRENTN